MKKLTEGKIPWTIQSHSGLLPPTTPFFLIAVRAVNRKPEATKSEVMFTLPPSRTQIRIYGPAGGCAHAKYETEQRQVLSGHGKRSYLLLPFPTCTSCPKAKKGRASKLLFWCNGYTMLPKHAKNTLYSQRAKNLLCFNRASRKHIALGRAALKRTQKCQDCRKSTFCLDSQGKRGLFQFGQRPI